jgi:2Fe-2S ferredoxin
MAEITFIEASGSQHRVQGEVGKSLMQIALDGGVPGILADCGGSATCGTCHGFVEAQWVERISRPAEQEAAVLDGLLDTQPSSRLTCQIMMTSDLDGIVIRLPSSQL